MSLAIALTKEQCFRLGKLVLQREPETAAKLIPLIAEPRRSQIDQRTISSDFLTFCSIQNIKPESYRGNIYKHSKTEIRGLFVAVMVIKYGSASRNIGKYLSATLGQKKQWTSQMIGEAETRYRCNAEYRDQVNGIIKKMEEI